MNKFIFYFRSKESEKEVFLSKIRDFVDKIKIPESDCKIIWDEDNSSKIAPNLVSFLKSIDSKDFSSVFVFDVDHLSKDPFEILELVSEFNRSQKPLRTISGNMDLGGNIAKFSEKILKAAQKKTIKKNSSRSSKPYKKGTMPYGLKASQHPNIQQYQINEEEFEIVKEIMEMHSIGNSYAYIARSLNSRGVPTKSNKKGKKATSWHPSTVRYIVKNKNLYEDYI